MKVLIISLCCIVFGSEGYCQGKVLIASRDSNSFVEKAQMALAPHYAGTIDIHFGLLPGSLSQYDAIFTDLRFFPEKDDSALIASELQKLSDFLISKGNLYIELGFQTIYRWGIDPQIYNENLTFHKQVGRVWFGQTALSVQGLDRVMGVKGSFTDGLSIAHPPDDPWRFYGYMGVEGELTTVLHTNTIITLAWVHEKENRKIVFHDPQVIDHYTEFLGRVACNYFGLCKPLDVAEVDATLPLINYDVFLQQLYTRLGEIVDITFYTILGQRGAQRRIEGALDLALVLKPGMYYAVCNNMPSQAIKVWVRQ